MALLAMVATVMLSLKQQRKCNYEAEVFVCVSLHIQHGRKLDGSSHYMAVLVLYKQHKLTYIIPQVHFTQSVKTKKCNL